MTDEEVTLGNNIVYCYFVSHDKTRNFGASLATGDYLIFLTQDAVPDTDGWFSNLTSKFEDTKKRNEVLNDQRLQKMAALRRAI